MLKTGIVSVTFRQKTPAQIIELSAANGLELVEWGGDIHCPAADPANAEAVGKLTRAGGMNVASFGSYFRAGHTPEENFAAEFAAAKALGAPNIRLWAGVKGHRDADDEYRAGVVRSLRACCAEAKTVGMTVSVEFHQGTLTDHYESAVRLAEEVAEDNFRLYWQPNQNKTNEYNLEAVRAVLPYLQNVHVFNWEGKQKFPLIDGEAIWRQYIDIIAEAKGDHALLLEFMCDGSAEQLVKDAATLNAWVRG